MNRNIPFTVIIVALALYGIWFVRRDLRRGTASGRGFRFDKAVQPKRYRALMGFNLFAVCLVCIGAILQLIGLARAL